MPLTPARRGSLSPSPLKIHFVGLPFTLLGFLYKIQVSAGFSWLGPFFSGIFEDRAYKYGREAI